jgi:hypothetical protein
MVAPRSTTRFIAAVAGVSDAGVRWSADGGIIEQDGSWTAPHTSGAFRVTAQSVADPTKTASARAVVESGEVAISIEPDRVTLSYLGPPFQFSARVTGTEDTAVSWSIGEPAGGSLIDATGTFRSWAYSATFRVIATSHADPSKTAVAVVTVTPNLVDHGGPVMAETQTFALWWGDASAFAPDARVAVERLLQGLDGSPYLAVADQYMRGARATTTFAGSLFDPSAPPPVPTGFVDDAACRALEANGIAPQPGDLVFVHTSNFPAEYIKWCAWHGWMACRGQTILIVYVPNPAGTFCEAWSDSCGTGYTMPTLSHLSAAAHEFMEAITNPFGDGWHSNGMEIADKCGSLACVPFPNGMTQLNRLYSNAVQGCAAE